MNALKIFLIAFTVVAGTEGAINTGTSLKKGPPHAPTTYGPLQKEYLNAAIPDIIPRTEWGALAPKRPPEKLSVNPAPVVIVHHSATDSCTSQAICQARVRSFQNYHMETKGWNDIGYNFLVGEDGNVYEGRGWGVKGAHSIPYNANSTGICIIGNFENRQPQAAAINAIKDLIAYGVSLGKINSSYTLYGHRQTSATTCPGNKLYELVQSWPHWQRK